MSTQTGLHYNHPCADGEFCQNPAAPPTRNISEEHWSEAEAKRNRYCIPCRKAGCAEAGKHIPVEPREGSL